MTASSAFQPAATIADVIDRLERVIQQAIVQGDRIGYFAALYCQVTRAVARGIDLGEYDDNARMERFDVIFANRYLQALDAWRAGAFPGHAWQQSFACTRRWGPLVLQHLLLGMNAHIVLDLGIAAAQTAPGSTLPTLQADFNRINNTLGALVDRVESDLAEIWPGLRFLTWGTIDDDVVNFSMGRAREDAWSFAEKLAASPQSSHASQIAMRDRCAALVATQLAQPLGMTGLSMLPVRIMERGSVADKIRALR